MKLRLLTILLCFRYLFPAFSQSPDHQSLGNANDAADFNALMFSFDYSTNTNMLGNISTGIKQPSLSPSLVFFSRWGADFSAIGSFIDNSDDSLKRYTAELDLVLGYNITPFRNLTLYPSFAHYFHSRFSNELKSFFTDEFRVDADYNYKFISFSISAGYYMGKKNTFYAEAHHAYQIEFKRFLSRKGTLNLQPGIDANFGSYEYLNLYYLDELRENQWYYIYLMSFPAIARYVHHQMMEDPSLTRTEILDDYLEEKAQDQFKCTSVNLSLPVFFMIGKAGINLGVYAFIPVEQPDYLSDDVQFYFNVGISYSLDFKR